VAWVLILLVFVTIIALILWDVVYFPERLPPERPWRYLSERSEHWWIALATALLGVATIALIVSTASLEAQHSEEDWSRLTRNAVDDLSKATVASPARHVCARYVVAADWVHNIRAEDAGRMAIDRPLVPTIDELGDTPLGSALFTESLLEAVVDHTPLVHNYDPFLKGSRLSSLATSCLSSLLGPFDDAPSEKRDVQNGIIVSRLRQELIGYQNTVETIAGFALHKEELPESALIDLADSLKGTFDPDTKLFLEANAVYWFFKRGGGAVGKGMNKLKNFAKDEFDICKDLIANNGEPLGKCFVGDYQAKLFFSAVAETK
jgi:hypothetical protein